MNEEEKKRVAESIGTDAHGMELRTQDQDLWLLPAGERLELEGAEAVEAWRRALPKLRVLAEDASELFGEETVAMVMRDAQYRGEEALRRAVERSKSGA